MNKKVMRIITIVATILCVILISSISLATITANDIDGKASNVSDDKLKAAGNKVATIIRTVGIVIAVIILMILGIKYMMGSAEEKAEYKKVMMPYLIGAAILFGASALAGTVIDLAEGLTQG